MARRRRLARRRGRGGDSHDAVGAGVRHARNSVLLLVLLAAACAAGSEARVQRKPAERGTTIERYAVAGIAALPDTALLADSVEVTLTIPLDCTNRITRLSTRFGAAGSPRTALLEVYGTVVHGRRPMCPIRLVQKAFLVKFPRRGRWQVEVRGAGANPPPPIRRQIVIR